MEVCARPRARRRCTASITPSASSTPAWSSYARAQRRCSTPITPSTLARCETVRCEPAAHPARVHPAGSAACAAPCPRASERSPVKYGAQCTQSCTLPWQLCYLCVLLSGHGVCAAVVCVYYCSTYYQAVRGGGGEGERGGHVLRETTSRGLCERVCPSRTNEQEVQVALV